jgi:FkbM family methyltransferase
MDFDESELFIHAEGDWRNFRSHACAKEPETASWIRRVISPDSVFYDIGACVGSYSLIASALGATIHAFEPSALNYSQLQKNTWLNRSVDLTAWPVALTSKTTPLRIGLSSLQAGAASHDVSEFGNRPDHRYALQETERVEQSAIGFALDEFASMFHLPQPTDIKIDVDGGEVSVLEGARKTIKLARSVMVEVDSQSAESVAAILLAAGLEETGSWPRTGGQSNHLFERSIVTGS